MKQIMDLPPIDENWYCDECNISFKHSDEPDFAFCPNCGKILKNDMYQIKLESVIEDLKNIGKSVCDECLEEFDLDYNFCPVCSNKLRKEIIKFKVNEKDNSVYAEWNDEYIRIFDRDEFVYDPHFSCKIGMKCFENKSSLDEKLEWDFKRIERNPPQKITYKEAYSIYNLSDWGNEIRIIEFIPELNEDILESNKFKFNKKNLLY